ncbi:hypothetical protein CsSME_00035590 [Camellia sinensis var. sinensis]
MAKLNLSPSLSLPHCFFIFRYGFHRSKLRPHRRQSTTTIPSSSTPQVARPEPGQALRLRPGGPHSPLRFRHFRHRRSPQRAPLLCLLQREHLHRRFIIISRAFHHLCHRHWHCPRHRHVRRRNPPDPHHLRRTNPPDSHTRFR